MSGGSKKQTVGYRYYLGLHMGLCAGPVDALLKISIGDREAWSGNVTVSGSLTIDKPGLFGGEKREGGVQGTLDVMMGEATQAANAYLASRQSGPQPAYRGLLGVVFRQGLISANNPYIKPWAFKLRRILQGWQSGTAWYSAKAAITLPSGDQAMNPAHIVYECLTNGEWGAGNGSSLIDDANFRAAADVFHAEGLGLCIQWMRQQPIEQFIQIVLDHAGANLGQDRRTGLFVMRLLRGGYDVDDLPVYDESSVLALDSYQRPAQPEQVNEVTVQFDDVATGQGGSVTVQNLANITSQGGVVTQGRNYPGLPTAELAMRVALRDLRAVSSPTAKVRLQVNRKGYNLLPGDLIRLNWSKLGITGLVLRVLQVNAGTITDGAIQVDCSEDVYGLPSTSYAAQQPTGWVSPNSAPAAAAYRLVQEAPYYAVQLERGTAEAQAMAADAGYIAAHAVRPASDAHNFELRTRATGSGAAYGEQDTGDFVPTGTLAADLTHTATSATLQGLVDGDLIEAGTLAQVDSEIVRIDTWDAGTGAVTLGRGVLDTVATTHAAGARVFVLNSTGAIDFTERVDAESVDVKLLPTTGLGTLAEGSAPTDVVVLDQRAARPYPPGQFRIAGLAYPTLIDGASPSLTWVHRDRLQQNTEGDETGSIGPEAGTTYAVEYSNADTTAVLVSTSGLSGTSYTPPVIPGSFNLRVKLWSVRDGLASRQRHDWTFSYTSALSIDAIPVQALTDLQPFGSDLIGLREAEPGQVPALRGRVVVLLNPANMTQVASRALTTTGEYATQMVVSGGVAFIGFNRAPFTSYVYRVTPGVITSGDTPAQFSSGAPIDSVAHDGTHLWVGDFDGNLYKLDPTTLAVVTTYPLWGSTLGMVYDPTTGHLFGGMKRINPADGSVVTTYSRGGYDNIAPVIVRGDLLFSVDYAFDGRLCVHQVSTGTLLRTDTTIRVAQSTRWRAGLWDLGAYILAVRPTEQELVFLDPATGNEVLKQSMPGALAPSGFGAGRFFVAREVGVNLYETIARVPPMLRTASASLIPGAALAADPHFASVELLLHFDGANGSPTFTDVMGKAITRQGSAQISTAQSVAGGASGEFDGSGDYLTAPDSADWDFGSGDFTVEAWIRPTASSGAGVYRGLVTHRQTGTSGFAWALYLNGDAGGQVRFDYSTSGTATAGSASGSVPALNTWTHVAAVRSGANLQVFVNGVGGAVHNIGAATVFDSTALLAIGRLSVSLAANEFAGFMDELRITKGVGRYTADFIPQPPPWHDS